jgi:hypothetical protein
MATASTEGNPHGTEGRLPPNSEDFVEETKLDHVCRGVVDAVNLLKEGKCVRIGTRCKNGVSRKTMMKGDLTMYKHCQCNHSACWAASWCSSDKRLMSLERAAIGSCSWRRRRCSSS